jgi:hypothetical protein
MTTEPTTERWPDLFTVGAPKAGTTSLHRYLQAHPQVFMSRHKEPGYFAPDATWILKERRMRHPTDRDEYVKLFRNAGDALRVGESSTNYLMSHEAPRLIHELNPAAYIIAMVRNPVDLLYSFHGERMSSGAETIADFEQALAADEDRRSGRRLTHGVSGYGVAYRDYAFLGQQLQRWLSQFGRDRIHVIVYDDFIRDTAGEYAKVLDFIDVDTAFRPESFANYNPSHRRRGRGVGMILRNPATRWFARTGLPAVIGERRTAALGKRFSLRRLNRRAYDRPPLAPDVRTRLEPEFVEDVKLLGSLIGRDLLAEWFTSRDAAAAA